MHLPHLSDTTKHHLYLAGAAIIVIGGLWAIANKDRGTANELGIDPNSLLGYKDKTGGFLSKGKNDGGIGGGNFSFTLPGLPTGGGTSDGAIQSYNNTYVSNTPSSAPATTSNNSIVNAIMALAAPTPAPTIDYTPAPTVPDPTWTPTLGPTGIYDAGINPNTGNPVNPLTGGDVTPQDLANLGQNAGAAYTDPNATADNNAAQFYSQSGNVDANGQAWVDGSPPTT